MSIPRILHGAGESNSLRKMRGRLSKYCNAGDGEVIRGFEEKQGTHETVRLESETTPDSASAGWSPSRVPQTQIGRSPELREGGVLEGLGSAQAHHGLGLDLDGLAGLRVAAHARLAVGFHRAADIGDDEFSRSALALSYRQLEELFKKHRCSLLRGAALFSNVRYDLRLAHRL